MADEVSYIMRNARSSELTSTNALLYGHTLEVVDSWKYFNVLLISDLSWHTHVDKLP